MLGNSAAVDWAHQVNLLRDLEAEKAPASCNSLRLGRVIFLLGLARFHGFGTSIQIDRGLEMILEAAVLGFLPARCVYRRLYDAVSSLRRFAGDGTERCHLRRGQRSLPRARSCGAGVLRRLFSQSDTAHRAPPMEEHPVAVAPRQSRRV